MKIKLLATSLSLLITSTVCVAESNLNVSVTANDGIRIVNEKEVILVDAIYEHYTNWEGFSYDAMPEGLVEGLSQEKKSISMLTTHIHRDHFHPRLSGELMDSNKNIISYGPQQVVESIKEGFINEHRIRERLNCIGSKQCQSEFTTENKLKIIGISLTHNHEPYQWIDNVAYFISNKKQTILHLGDANLSPDNISKISHENKSVDLAFLPYWVIMQPNTFDSFMQSIKPKKVVLIHFPEEQIEQLKSYVGQMNYKNILVSLPGKKISF